MFLQKILITLTKQRRLTCDYQGDDMQIGIQLVFLTEMLTNLQSDMIMLEMSLPNRAGILTLLMD
jgi:DNA polymerase-3 subunit beta